VSYLVLTVILNAAAQFLMKLSASSKSAIWLNPYFIASAVLFGVSLLAWQKALSSLPLSAAMPALLLSYGIVVICAHLFLGETVSTAQYFSLAIALAALTFFWMAK
jgi:multidrug transporter EmrE-like cation transporter